MKDSRNSKRINLLEEWEEALDMEMPHLGDEAVRLVDEFNDLMSGERASILTRTLNLPFELLDTLTKRRKK